MNKNASGKILCWRKISADDPNERQVQTQIWRLGKLSRDSVPVGTNGRGGFSQPHLVVVSRAEFMSSKRKPVVSQQSDVASYMQKKGDWKISMHPWSASGK